MPLESDILRPLFKFVLELLLADITNFSMKHEVLSVFIMVLCSALPEHPVTCKDTHTYTDKHKLLQFCYCASLCKL